MDDFARHDYAHKMTHILELTVKYTVFLLLSLLRLFL